MLTWPLVQSQLAWGFIILLGGGFALAEGAQRSCLTNWVGAQLSRFSFLSPEILRLLICAIVSCLTQVSDILFNQNFELSQRIFEIFQFHLTIEMFYLNSTLNFGIPPVLQFQLEVYCMVDRLLIGLNVQHKGTTAQWYSNKTSL